MEYVQGVRVLGVQSGVVHGYVGNRAAQIALPMLGIDIDVLFTTQLSNHTHYPYFCGTVLSAADAESLFDGVRRLPNGGGGFTHLLSGYCPAADVIKVLAKEVETRKAALPSFFFFCDPVMGDDNKLYVPQEAAEAQRDFLVPLADCVKCNLTEAAVIAGFTPEDKAGVLRMLDAIHARGPPRVVVTSCPPLNEHSEGKWLSVVISERQADGSFVRHFVDTPIIERYVCGTGDVFAGLLLGWLIRGFPLKEAVERTANAMYEIVKRTIAAGSIELHLLQSRKDMTEPTIVYVAEELN